MIFTPKNKNEITPVIKINDNRIDRVSEFCFLGVNIDGKMTWNSHINKIATKISRTIGLFHKLKYFLPIFTMRTLYCSLILPHLTYCNLAWGKNITRLNKLQKKAVRAITNSKFNAHTEPLLKLLNLLNIKDTYILNNLKFYYKYIHNILPPYFQTYEFKLTSEMHNYNTRTKQKYFIFPTNHKYAEYCARHQLPQILNQTNAVVLEKIHAHSFASFVNYVKHTCIENYQERCLVENCYICNSNNT